MTVNIRKIPYEEIFYERIKGIDYLKNVEVCSFMSNPVQ